MQIKIYWKIRRTITFRNICIWFFYGSKGRFNFELNLDNIEQVCASQMLILFWYGSKAWLDFVLNLDNGGAVKQNIQTGYTIHREKKNGRIRCCISFASEKKLSRFQRL